jgi:hypothetical protein
LQQAESSIQLAFRCHDEMDLAIIRCPANPSMSGECTLGYQGYLCQTCADDYGMMPSRLCEPCAGTGFTTKSLLILVAIIAGVMLVVGTAIKYWRKFPFKLAVATPVNVCHDYNLIMSVNCICILTGAGSLCLSTDADRHHLR